MGLFVINKLIKFLIFVIPMAIFTCLAQLADSRFGRCAICRGNGEGAIGARPEVAGITDELFVVAHLAERSFDVIAYIANGLQVRNDIGWRATVLLDIVFQGRHFHIDYGHHAFRVIGTFIQIVHANGRECNTEDEGNRKGNHEIFHRQSPRLK